MRYCLQARETKEYLRKADEIMVDWRDHEIIIDYVQDYPEKMITLNCSPSEDVDWQLVKQYSIMLKGNLQACLESELDIDKAKDMGVKYFLPSLLRDFYSLNRYISLGVCAIRITAPLTHYLDELRKMDLHVEIRVFPNLPGIIPTETCNGLTGGWFRPEDLYQLDDIIDVAEFAPGTPIKREQALYRIYAEDHQWSGALDLLIDDFTIKDMMNRMIPPEFQERRSNCRQRCQFGSRNCHYCELLIKLTNPEFLKPVKEQINGTAETVVEENTERITPIFE